MYWEPNRTTSHLCPAYPVLEFSAQVNNYSIPREGCGHQTFHSIIKLESVVILAEQSSGDDDETIGPVAPSPSEPELTNQELDNAEPAKKKVREWDVGKPGMCYCLISFML